MVLQLYNTVEGWQIARPSEETHRLYRYPMDTATDYPPDYSLTTWRLIRSGPADGATNMAVDEAILHAVAAGRVPPTLRLYAWEPGCLSLGRAQPADDVDWQALAAAGLDIVRRPTGGKAILHVDELTYSVVAPETEPRVRGGIVESYRRLSAGLVRGLQRLGVTGLVADQRAENRHLEGAVCFEVPSDYEITAGGRKLAGSAQMRARSAVLQHGTVPLHGDITRICPLLTAHPDPGRVHARATTVEEALGRAATWHEVADAMVAGFAEALKLRLEPGTLTDEERAGVKRLRAEKYATREWTKRV
jgi:lipoate-protein ligase A